MCLAAAPLSGWDGPVVLATDPACDHHEPRETVWCDPCGACCREAFDAVPVGAEDQETADLHPELITGEGDWRSLRRVPGIGDGTRCIALRGDGAADQPFRCVIYSDRPSPCRDLMPGEPNCLLARRRVGLSPG